MKSAISQALSGVALAAAICAAGAAPAAAQGFFQELFGPDRPAAPQYRGPRAAPQTRESRQPNKKKPESRQRKEERKAPATAAKNAAPPPEPPPPPYDAQMMRLAEIIGALSFLRDLCGDSDGGQWRAQMSALLDAEAPSPGARRQRLTASYNRGFRGYELTYRACTPNARTAISRYMDESAKIAHDIAYRYGNP